VLLNELHMQRSAAHDLAVRDSSDSAGQGQRPRTQRQARAESTRRQLLASAVELFSKRNFDDVSTTDITEDAGVAQGLLFHYFGNKRGIYLEALREAAGKLKAANTPTPGEREAGALFREMMSAHLEYMSENRDLALRLVLGGSGGDPDAWEIFDQSRWHTIEWTCRLLNVDPYRPAVRLMLRSCSGAVDEAVTYWLKHDQPFDLEQMVEVVVDLTVASLRCAAQLDPGLDVGAAVLLLGGRQP
jgi:AcrR family transcriptional regulator